MHTLEAAEDGFQRALRFAAREFAQDRPIKDLFAIQSRIIEHLRLVLNDPGHSVVPEVPTDAARMHRLFHTEIAQLSQMWATRPPNATREENLKRRCIACAIDARPAMELLHDAQALRERVSLGMFNGEAPTCVDTAVSLEQLEREFAALSLSRRYQGSTWGAHARVPRAPWTRCMPRRCRPAICCRRWTACICSTTAKRSKNCASANAPPFQQAPGAAASAVRSTALTRC
ncbi:hypothetical protein BRM22_25330 [Xanthomonas oryzae pv. oryzae]|uniref:Uncharacterized protein n=2 Tax=Xanthomonas oryzae pv. oryzae TaxID=64187 RepID=Q5H6X4_XANOR|nr:hypothetical protein XOO0042 [Xanthomonas oryzae pv. oryzae KACC 10331]AOS00788.1 hypothetical protein ATY42_00620 [Xanthomonas oryzae pv. oryzae]QUW76325.1 hypothetical protein KCI36_04315 [Xanthomonas oryzae]BAE66885.1 hypothetical protein [Xanthomonas oryzae pv. oryzae MAFF 311018]AOS13186.1 hypothetical protein ATY45_00205 [Xanthomonas oryzae pv. oryzae]